MRIAYLIIALISLGCNSKTEQSKPALTKNKYEKCFSYPASVDSANLRALYDSARWFIYTWHCDQLYLPKQDTSRSTTFGELPLRFDNIKIKNDSLELNFDFMDKNQNILPSMTRDIKELSTGVGFNIKLKQKIYMISPSGFTTVMKGGNNRYEQPLQQEVLDYIKSHWDKLDNCFRELAIQHGIRNQ